jgi:hypothetical protein
MRSHGTNDANAVILQTCCGKLLKDEGQDAIARGRAGEVVDEYGSVASTLGQLAEPWCANGLCKPAPHAIVADVRSSFHPSDRDLPGLWE